MDINITGQVASTLADNLKQNPYIIVGASALGGAVTGIITLIAISLNNRNEKIKRMEENIQRVHENKKQVYQEFIDVFSTNILISSTRKDFLLQSSALLKAALKAAEFGNPYLLTTITLSLTTQVLSGNRTIQSLNDLIRLILEIRSASFQQTESTEYGQRFDNERLKLMGQARKIGSENFSELFLKYLINGEEIRFTPP